ncbi:oligoendopeptidase F [Spirochaeta isovalerica]|uniref:Oligopeptidase F n=1 Tax=Spirochaeta isovalerica TaxID=150 RepID=A0A841RAK6_9SPIO|nr:oligoendopeptidase F [Spirochaeta isovalerica]MBB6480050.1 oligoendopeptidase F [Spirochaeta isovalerica]
MEKTSVPRRSDIPKEQTWNAEAVFPDRAAWKKAFEELKKELPVIDGFEGTLSSSPDNLIKWLKKEEELSRKAEKLGFYAYMAMAVNGDDAEATSMVSQIQSMGADLNARSAFADPEILAMDEKKLRGWLESEKELAPYRHSLEDLIRTRPHVRSGEVEEVLGLVSDPFGSVEMTFNMLSSMDMKIKDAVGKDGGSMDVTQSNIEEIKKHPDRKIRQSGMENYADAYLGLRHTYAGNYIASAKQTATLAKIRGYDSVLQYKLSPYNIPTDVFHNLIDTFKSKLPVWHRYWDVKRRLLKLDEMRPYDIWAPLTEKQPEYSFTEAVDLIGKGMAPLGDKYVSTVRKGCLEDRWVDYGRNKGKSQGAFSYGTYDTYPCIMLSYDNTLTEVSTLAHELGHSMHSYLTHENQSYSDSHYSMFVAEVASNFNQAMVRDYLFKTDEDRDFQLAVIQEAMDNIHRYFFIMPTLARFEFEVFRRLEAGEPLNADILQEIMSGFYAEGYGDALKDDEERTSITWATFGHLYEPFYTFQYATGISAAHALCYGILDGKENAVENYLKFLSLGNSVYPLEALATGGVDMMSSEPVEAGFKVLEALIDRLEKLID